jgi:hypothetical protein
MKEYGKLTKKLILLVHGESSDLNEWRGWCQEVHAALPEDLKERRRMRNKTHTRRRSEKTVAITLLGYERSPASVMAFATHHFAQDRLSYYKESNG